MPICECPDGYTPSPDGLNCIKEETAQATLPQITEFCSRQNVANNISGIIYYGSLNNYVWPLLTVPQAADTYSLDAMTVIPNSGTNSITGDSWTSISPAPQSGGQHSAIVTPDFSRPFPNPNPLGIIPLNTSAPGTTVSSPYPFYQSTLVSGTLGYGQGSQIPFAGFQTDTPVFNDAYYTVNNVWKYSGTGDIIYQWCGFKVCLKPTTDTVYQIAFMANNGFRAFVNDNLAVEGINGNGGTFLGHVHVFEITLPAGVYDIKVECYNYTGDGGLVCDILECTYSQFTAITTQAQLDSYRVFSTFWKQARPMTVVSTGTDTITINLPGVSKFYDLNGFFDSPGFPVNAYVTEVIDSATYKFNQTIPAGTYTGNLRFLFTASSDVDKVYTCPSGYDLSFCDGVTCTKTIEIPCGTGEICYLLQNCQDSQQILITGTDLSAYLGKVIKIEGCKDICWLVVNDEANCENCNQPVVVLSSYSATQTQTACDACLPPPPPIIEPPLLITRAVKPGYTTPGCSPEYTEKVNSNFSDQVYAQMLSVRYGLTTCCEGDLDYWDIKKELLDLKAINDNYITETK